MTDRTFKKRINEIIINQLDLPEDCQIKPDNNLQEDFDADSLDAVCIIMSIESAFQININDEDCGDVKTVQDIYDYVTKRLDESGKSNKSPTLKEQQMSSDNFLEQFQANNGILQPIRAIVYTKPQSPIHIAKMVKKIALAQEALTNDHGLYSHTAAKKVWATYVNRSNVVGYFAAYKSPDYELDGEIRIGYSFCKPEDWWKFNAGVSQKIAINKRYNQLWCVAGGNGDLRRIVKRHAHSTMCAPLVYDFRHMNAVYYCMLGTINEQLDYFVKRVRKYFKTGEQSK